MSAKYVSRPPSSPGGSPPGAAPSDPSFVSRCPALWEYLTLLSWEDGAPREPATMILMVEEGRWKACLSDRATGRTLWRVGDTLAALLEALEGSLASGEADWRRGKAPPPRRGRS